MQRTHVSKIERGEHMPTMFILFRLCGALDVSASSFLREVEGYLREFYSQSIDFESAPSWMAAMIAAIDARRSPSVRNTRSGSRRTAVR